MENYPLKCLRKNTNLRLKQVRSRDINSINQIYGSDKLRSTFMNDALKTLNLASISIKNCKSLISAKKGNKELYHKVTNLNIVSYPWKKLSFDCSVSVLLLIYSSFRFQFYFNLLHLIHDFVKKPYRN